MSAEVGRAVGRARLTRKEANEIVIRITDKYQPRIDDRTAHTIGLTYQEAYDVEEVRPKAEFMKTYNQVKSELKEEFGLPMKLTGAI
jgi:methylamine--corrinoid protein Co-methyltransferase